MKLLRFYKILFILCLLNVSFLFSIERIETEEIINNDRDYSLAYYEDETAISHWYGSETWAVKFVAEDFMVNATSLTISTVNLFFPTIPSSTVNIRGFTYTEDSQYDPLFGEEVAELNVLNHTITEVGWHQFTLSIPYTAEGLWVIVDNQTNFSNNFMASATGSGKNSYYKVNNGSSVFFSNLYDINVSQEFLFSIDGYLSIDNDTDRVVIRDTRLEYSHEDLWEYKYNIRNYSTELITSALLEIEIQHPDPEVYDTTFTYITLDLAPQSDISSDDQEPLYLPLPIMDSQYRIATKLKRSMDSNHLSSKIIRVCNFQADSDTAIIMNFVSGNYDVTDIILNVQRNIAQPNWQVINYGVDGSDQLFYSDYAYDYYHDIGVNLMPLTLINGTKYFNSYNTTAIEDNLQNNIYYIPKVFDITEEGSEQDGSAITYYASFNYGNRYVFNNFTDNLALDVFITQKTKHYSETGDEFIVSKIDNVDYNFARLSEDGDGFFEFTYESDNVDSLFTTSNGEKYINGIIYREDTNEIISYHRYSLQDNILVSNQDEENNQVVDAFNFTLYPNPVKSGQTLNISSTAKISPQSYTLYNLRGQKVDKFENDNNSIKIPKNISSGVYFLRPSLANKKRSPLVKLMIIKE
ncbi:T9SS type A sorting domain-containing protein [bacterium]|nr:T9SS type A sorting domain-containing protein [bacterium]